VKLDGLPILHENLLQKHSRNLACFHVSVGNEVPVRPIWAIPAQLEAVRFRTVRLDQDEALSRNLGLNATAQGLKK
jgi:hypothetical protein